ncbi:MAG TPA: alpha-galactosidase [Lacunisphaera sp.]|nr:alpha-galactosidase [Lacunisphaera sp.]
MPPSFDRIPAASSRRDFIRLLGLGTVAGLAQPRLAFARPGTAGEPLKLEGADWLVRLDDGSVADPAAVTLERRWSGASCRARLVNRSPAPLGVREIVVFRGPHGFGADTALYGESFQMLSQTCGSLGQPVKLGFDEAKHYRLPQPADAVTVRSLAMLSPAAGPRHLLAFASCRRFAGEIRLWPDRYEIVLDTEGRTLAPGAAWELEEFIYQTGPDREALFAALGDRIGHHHPRLAFPKLPTGWCSWYYYSKGVTEADILANLDAIARDRREGIDFEYIQIDDGYQPAHGDWLDPNPKKFPEGIKALCHKIRERGFQPAIWVAPFIAAPQSRLLRERPEWFVAGPDGKPLAADQVTFAGWNEAPWYMLDATIPAVQAHLERVFRVMREEWGCTYFKLDANFWGAVHGSRYADPAATRIENYRRGMAAVIRGAGRDSFILGCNAPMWASLGVVHGMRVTGDIKRDWSRFVRCARELFYRNWQHGRLWINDPDCIVVSKRIKSKTLPEAPLTDDEMGFHAAAILASGAMMLDGDDYTGLTAAQKARLKKCLPPTNVPARFAREDFSEGRAELPDGRMLVFAFNWGETPRTHTVDFAAPRTITDYWTGEKLGTHARLELSLPPHSARVLLATSP